MDLVMIRPPGIDNGAFVVSPDSVWYARVLLLFSASAMTDTGSKTFECALVSTLETYDDPDNGNYIYYSNYTYYAYYNFAIITLMHAIALMLIIACSSVQDGWNLSALGWFMSLTTGNLSYTSFPFRVSSANFLWFPLVTPAPSRTTCATHSLALPATAGWVLAMDARCGSSTRGLWVGRGTCNES